VLGGNSISDIDPSGRLLIEAKKEKLGHDHPDTLETLNDFGVLRREQGQYGEAENLLIKAHDGRLSKHGPDHPATLESMQELGLLHMVQSQYEKAESPLREAYCGREVKLGSKHPHTIESLRQIILLYEAWGKPKNAQEWQAKLQQQQETD